MLRYGLIGAGNVGSIHLEWAQRHPDVTVCAIADPDEAKCQSLAASCGACAYTDHNQMLANERLDFVSIATPHNLLAPLGMDCLTAGCHLLLEKPLARHIGEAAPLVAKASERGLQIGTMYQYRSFATPKLIQSIIQSGQIGEVRHIIWTWHELRPASYYSQAPWKSSWAGAGGGLLINQLSHELDLLRWYAGDVSSVHASICNLAHDVPVEDSVSATLHFQNGAVATIAATLNQSRTHTYRAIMGTKGLIVLPDAKPLSGNHDDTVEVGLYTDEVGQAIASFQDDHQQSDIKWTQHRSKPSGLRRWLPEWSKAHLRKAATKIIPGRKDWKPGMRPVDGHGKLLWDFVDAIRSGKAVLDLMSGANALKTLEVVNALIASGIEKRAMDLPLDAEAYSDLFDSLSNGDRRLHSSGASSRDHLT